LRIPEELEEGRDEFEQDEFRCLNINVSVPLGHPSTMELLPVLIWIHGKVSFT
jgi:carboxylesterase type B